MMLKRKIWSLTNEPGHLHIFTTDEQLRNVHKSMYFLFDLMLGLKLITSDGHYHACTCDTTLLGDSLENDNL